MSRLVAIHCLFFLTVNLCLVPLATADAPQDRVSVSLGEFTSLDEGRGNWQHAARFEEAVARSAGTPLARAPLHLTRISSDGKVRFFYRSRLRSNGDVAVGVQVEVLRQQSERVGWGLAEGWLRQGEWERVWLSRTELPERGASEGEEVSPIVTVPVGFGAPPVATFRVVVKSFAGERETQPVETTFSLAFPSRFFVPFSEQLALEPGAIWLDANVSRALYAQLRQSLELFRQTRAAPRETRPQGRPQGARLLPCFSPDTVQTAASIVERLRDVAVPGMPQRTSALGDVGGSLSSLKTYLRVAAIVAPRAATADEQAVQVFSRQYPDLLTAVDALTGEGDGSLLRLAEATRPYFVAAVGGSASTDYAPLQRQLWAVMGNVAIVQQALSVVGDYAPPVVEKGVPVVKPAHANFAPAASAFGDFFLRVNAHLAVLAAFYERMDTRAQGADLPAYTMPPSPEQLVLTAGNSRPNDAGLHQLASGVPQTFTVTADGQPVPDADVSFYRVTVRNDGVDAPEPMERVTDARGRVTLAPEEGGYWVTAEKDGCVTALMVFEAAPAPQPQRLLDAPRRLLPDLVISDIQSSGYLTARQSVWLFARVANVGQGDAQGPFYVVFEGKRGTSALDRFETIGVATVPRVHRIVGGRAGGRVFDSLMVRTDWVPPAPGDYTLRVTVNPDVDGVIEPLEENDFRNNSRTVTVRVGGTPYAVSPANVFSLAVTEILVVPAGTYLCCRQPVTVLVRVCNVGSVPVPFYNIGLRLLAGGVLVREYVLPCWTVNGFERIYLAPGEEAVISGLTWTPTIAGHIPLGAEIVALSSASGYAFSGRPRTVFYDVLNTPVVRVPQPPFILTPPNPSPQRGVDLAVSPTDVTVTPDEPRANDFVRVTVTVHNNGDGDAHNVIVRATLTGAGGLQTAVQSLSLIRSGSSAAVTLTFPPTGKAGRCSARVEVSLLRSEDRNRDNNEATRDFRVRPAREEKKEDKANAQ